jgi:hypothetical protein
MSQHSLGALYLSRYERSGDDAHARQADQHYRAALEEYRQEIAPVQWATAQHSLGALYLSRYERSGDDAHACQVDRHYRAALEVCRREVAPAQWATAQHSLGNLYYRRYERSGDDTHARQADQHHQAALEEYRRDVAPAHWATAQHSLGNLYFRRYERSGDDAHARQADQHYRAALEVRRRDLAPGHWATVQHSLGNLYFRRYERSGDDAQARQADQHYRAALEVRRRDVAPAHWATVQHSLGNLYATRYERSGDDAHARRAQRRYALVLAGSERYELPEIFVFRAAAALTRLQVRLHAWQEAALAYGTAAGALGKLYAPLSGRESKEAWLAEAQALPANAAYALAKLYRLEEAVETLEAGRARLLAEALEQNRRDLERLAPLGHGDLLARYRAAVDRVAALQAQAGQPLREQIDAPAPARDYEALPREMAAARAARDAAVVAIRQVAGYEDFFLPPSFEKTRQAAAPGAPLVYLVTTVAGSLALVVRAAQDVDESAEAQTVVAVWLDGFTSADLDTLLVHQAGDEVIGGYLPGQLFRPDWLQASLGEALPVLGERLMGPLAGRLRALGFRQLTLVADGRPALLPLHAARYQRDGQELAFLDEFAVSYTPTARAAGQARAALREHKPHTARLAGVGNPLPDRAELEALREELRAAAQTLADDNPGLAACQELDRALAQPLETLIQQGAALLGLALRIREAVGPPADALVSLALRWPASLVHARSELESVVDLLPAGASRALYEQEARRGALLKTLPGATLVHLACHGAFRPDDPLQSGLLLADGELTLRNIMANDFTALDAARLVVLSACQTAITDFRTLPDEAIGLPAGLIQAGVPAVVGTLWSVNDASTALVMVRFYELLLQDSLAAPEALRQAQRWLRDVTNAKLETYLTRHETLARARRQEGERMALPAIQALLSQVLFADPAARPYADPYYWAPFVFYGSAEAHP